MIFDRFLAVIESFTKTMAKSNAERQKLYGINLSKNESKYEQIRQKSCTRDNTRRQNLYGDSLGRLRIRQRQT